VTKRQKDKETKRWGDGETKRRRNRKMQSVIDGDMERLRD
jgi:hypothetical protein